MRKFCKKICIEGLISRINGLFPYIEFEDGGVVLHRASESVDGCYGHIVPNITIPASAGLVVDGVAILSGGRSYSYRSIIGCYHEYSGVLSDDNAFMSFVNKYIGKELIDRKHLLGDDFEAFDLVPEYVYLSEVGGLAEEMRGLRHICDAYSQNTSVDGWTDVEMCCACKRYERMGGDVMLAYYDSLIPLRDERSDEAYCLVPSGYDAYAGMMLQIPLESKSEDLGIFSCYINNWQGGIVYEVGDVVTYDGETYVCKTQNSGHFDEESMTIVFPYVDFEKMSEWGRENHGQSEFDDGYSQDGFYTSKNVLGDRYRFFVDVDFEPASEYVCDYLRYGNAYYRWDGSSYVVYQEAPDFYHLNGSTDSKLKSLRLSSEFINQHSAVETPPNGEDWLFYYKKNYTNAYSILYDDAGNMLSSTDRSQWTPTSFPSDYDLGLYAYGNVIKDISYIDVDDEHSVVISYVLGAHLKARPQGVSVSDGISIYMYGDFEYDDSVICGITHTERYPFDPGGEISELIAQSYFEKFTDRDRWRNTYYSYNGTDIDVVVVNEIPVVQIPGVEYIKYVDISNPSNFEYRRWDGASYSLIDGVTEFDYTGKRMAFGVEANNGVCEVEVLDTTNTTGFVVSEYETEEHNSPDFVYSGIFRTDFLCGISFDPSVYSNMSVQRGNASAFERHVKLGEIRTMEDLQDYANGGFFTFS